MPSKYDVIVIGSGPGGYSAAVAASRSGARVCLIEKDELGGVCVNTGCIPTKTMLNAAVLNLKIKNAEKYGFNRLNPVLDYAVLLKHVNQVISNIKQMMLSVIKAQKIDFINATAEILSDKSVKVGNNEISGENIIIAAGSCSSNLPDMRFDRARIFSSRDFLNNEKLPKTLLIVGGGVIGCEWAGIFASFGVKVTIVEAFEKILPGEDNDLTRVAEMSLKKMGVEIRVNEKINDKNIFTHEKIMICIGRKPATDNFSIIQKKQSGWIKTDEYMRTNLPNVYAVGDAAGNRLLAYTAQKEGEIAVSNIFGKKIKINYEFVPSVIFAIPEIASVGLKENQAGDSTGAVRAYFRGLGKAIADDETDGFVKIMYDKKNYKILGVGIVGKNASELISEAAIALKYNLTIQDWKEVIHPHPVLSEIFTSALDKI